MAFSISENQYQALLTRITALELQNNDLIVAIKQLASLQQVRELNTFTQTDLKDLRNTVEALQSRVTSIEQEPIN